MPTTSWRAWIGESDGLPRHENRFFDLLQTQSKNNLLALQRHAAEAYKGIRQRMDEVNASLEQVAFNRGTVLTIEVSDRRLPEVQAFQQQLRSVLAQQQTEDRALAEAQFDTLRGLVARLGAQDPEQRRWREQVLDVRLHVEFVGVELDAQTRQQIEIYRSGAGKSGGQRQKLATTCLAAALRYQLGGEDGELPRYCAVVLDEAFDKADNEFTALAMNIFENFGFQMIVATPLKSVMTLEPFIGGACFVEISGRHTSGVLLVEYDDEANRLRLPERARRGRVRRWRWNRSRCRSSASLPPSRKCPRRRCRKQPGRPKLPRRPKPSRPRKLCRSPRLPARRPQSPSPSHPPRHADLNRAACPSPCARSAR